MSFAKVHSAQTSLLNAHIIDIEVDLSRGLHSFGVVGLPDKAVEESRDRVSAAVKNSGFKSPKHKNQKIVISLAPADLKKEGPVFDIGIALAYLLAAEDINFDPAHRLFLGELALDGVVRPITGTLALAREAKERGFKEIYVPLDNAREAALIDGIAVYGVKNLKEIIAHLDTKEKGTESIQLTRQPATEIEETEPKYHIDFSDIKGQETAKRGLEIAAAGGHNIAMYGPPGTGKTMLAKAFAGILPALPLEDTLEVTAIHSIAGTLTSDVVIHPPFRSPHHSASYISLVGGGAVPKPGEVTLAHRGVLFLDEFAEFERRVIDALRQPLEDRTISISRAKGSATFPASFILVAAMNPCPCGNFGFKGKECVCNPATRLRYERKISGPIMDRIDMWIDVPRIDHTQLTDTTPSGPTSKEVREKIQTARAIQKKRLASTNTVLNSEMSAKDLLRHIQLLPKVKETLDKSATHLNLSARAYHRLIKLARTIADLEGSEAIEEPHILEALQYRPKKQY